ncbi:glutamine synthetase family protein [Zavarzinia compransoris]|uniref:Glutamine synthetase n=1 Tax=Zavarzinia compransoris TaxID=1264899 RepID=A0A317EBD7_9PROT|nr:glutamine synthetase family protein [Zavarzinia compransoris]PWR23470.1 glutamine synthetase [Zavarzinia compransoris]TDP45950.1 glutamate--putrescine ligase [Zavarzinia compransoris]
MPFRHPAATDGAEAAAFLAANPDIEAVQLVLTDTSGVARGKTVRAHELAAVYTQGRPLPCSILGLDVTGADVDETGLVWEEGDADRLAFPVPGTLRRAPWLPAPTAQVILSVWHLDGRPEEADPRHALARVVGRYNDLGLTPVVAPELEFYLVDPAIGADGMVQLPKSPLTGQRLVTTQVYELNALEEFGAFLTDLQAAFTVQKLPAETAISEFAPGQFEITLRHQPDALNAIDEAIFFKRTVRGIAQKHDLIATFMAKPFTGRTGSGLHLHLSMNDAAGRNAFASEDPTGPEIMRHAIAGLIATMPEATAIFAPGANSYRRFRLGSYAPIAPCWGVNNRSVSVRVPIGPASSRHVEHRVCGADANPYLALAAVLAGVHHGMTEQLTPPAIVEKDGYAETAERLPTQWADAIAIFERSTLMRDYLGARYAEVFTAIKKAELDRFYAQVSALDYVWYLRNA